MNKSQRIEKLEKQVEELKLKIFNLENPEKYPKGSKVICSLKRSLFYTTFTMSATPVTCIVTKTQIKCNQFGTYYHSYNLVNIKTGDVYEDVEECELVRFIGE